MMVVRRLAGQLRFAPETRFAVETAHPLPESPRERLPRVLQHSDQTKHRIQRSWSRLETVVAYFFCWRSPGEGFPGGLHAPSRDRYDTAPGRGGGHPRARSDRRSLPQVRERKRGFRERPIDGRSCAQDSKVLARSSEVPAAQVAAYFYWRVSRSAAEGFGRQTVDFWAVGGIVSGANEQATVCNRSEHLVSLESQGCLQYSA